MFSTCMFDRLYPSLPLAANVQCMIVCIEKDPRPGRPPSLAIRPRAPAFLLKIQYDPDPVLARFKLLPGKKVDLKERGKDGNIRGGKYVQAGALFDPIHRRRLSREEGSAVAVNRFSWRLAGQSRRPDSYVSHRPVVIRHAG
ncbi:hypothetical protein PoB_001227700 [Plakobranchus ocellatus]|uniref:Uncharacterized protein n=1 Tax=Plakobranchus ocellatus TaxID=259542 RepID=A0AAV3YS65_9GAST|nr:hypothetical protein PoB_001227700 [Plakobranchus ocellatus]